MSLQLVEFGFRSVERESATLAQHEFGGCARAASPQTAAVTRGPSNLDHWLRRRRHSSSAGMRSMSGHDEFTRILRGCDEGGGRERPFIAAAGGGSCRAVGGRFGGRFRSTAAHRRRGGKAVERLELSNPDVLSARIAALCARPELY